MVGLDYGCASALDVLDANILRMSDERKGQSRSPTWRRAQLTIGAQEVVVRLCPLTEIDDRDQAEWDALESRLAEGNIYLSSHFVLPASHYLDPKKRLLIMTVRLVTASGDRLIGLGIFIARPPSVRFPLPHLEAYRSKHTFLTGMLLDEDQYSVALGAIASYLSSSRLPWCGIRFENRFWGGCLDRMGESEGTPAPRWYEQSRHRRAVLTPAKASAVRDTVLADGRFGRELRRKRRRLDEMGSVGWRFVSGSDVDQEVIETFLRLEHQGWKADHGSSLLSNSAEADFFRTMSAGLAAQGRAFFTELTLDGRVIASTSNFISRDVGFAFKIGWDQEFAAVSPGLLNELELMRHAGQCLSGISYVDSGASEGAFIERLWREQCEVATSTLTGGYTGAAILPVLSVARRLKRGMA